MASRAHVCQANYSVTNSLEAMETVGPVLPERPGQPARRPAELWSVCIPTHQLASSAAAILLPSTQMSSHCLPSKCPACPMSSAIRGPRMQPDCLVDEHCCCSCYCSFHHSLCCHHWQQRRPTVVILTVVGILSATVTTNASVCLSTSTLVASVAPANESPELANEGQLILIELGGRSRFAFQKFGEQPDEVQEGCSGPCEACTPSLAPSLPLWAGHSSCARTHMALVSPISHVDTNR